jgi:hypothetical protein
MMITATLTTRLSGDASVQLTTERGIPTAAYLVMRADGPGPVPAAVVVLERNGWRLVSDWDHISSGVIGNMWMATVEQMLEGPR